ncbi:DUF998 domain-containing protein [Oxyplasma meridianum]|uniref:DUF998 domain-containing protein n=1 Tax=Oxyplasma meridianum TaxID=3073602 RepID=A0AAX4NEN9_9ARCH
MDMVRKLPIAYIGIAAMTAAWLTIFLAAALNPWFRFTGNALSDLGGGNLSMNGHPAPTDPFVYNVGLMIAGVLIALFSVSVILRSRNSVEIIGASYFMISGLFLALIGIYHEGTYPHDFVSIWFFILSSISYVAIAISFIIGKFRITGIILSLLLVLSWIAFAVVPWGSVAEDEMFGVAVIDVFVILHILTFRRNTGKRISGRVIPLMGIQKNGSNVLT